MDMKIWLKQATADERQRLASRAGTTVAYLYQIAGGHKKPGTKLCLALADAEPKLLLWKLRPDVWKEPAR